MNIIDKQNRNKLLEGRNAGMGFAFLKQLNETDFETIHPISACKEYLNDIIYTEITGTPVLCCGLQTEKKHGIFENTNLAYLGIKILVKQRSSDEYLVHRTLKGDIKQLDSNIENLTNFMHWFEDQFEEINCPTRIHKANDGMYGVEFDKTWCKSTPLISLYSFLLRVGMWWNGKNTPMEYLKTVTTDTNNIEYQMCKTIYRRLCQLLYCKSLKFAMWQDFTEYEGSKTSHIHATGIVTI